MKKNLLLSVFSLLFLSIQAQTVGTCSILKDLNPGTSSGLPSARTMFNGKAYFNATNGFAANGNELWVTDGTTAGTKMLKDINPSTASSSPTGFTPINATTMLFSATTPLEGTELWKTDGTEAGTVLVSDINAGTSSGAPTSIVALNGKAYFRGTLNLTIGAELWVSDGTEAGTKMLKDINPGGGSSPVNLTVFKNKIYFSASDTSSTGTELWVTDGTEAGTQLVKDINPGKANSSPLTFAVAGNYLYFRATDSIGGTELWRTDGTGAGTLMVKDIYSGRNATDKFNNSSPTPSVDLNGKLIFTATDTAGTELWITDGTDAGTKMIKNICPTAGGSSSPAAMYVWKNKVYFRANDCTNGIELWASDGTDAGTAMVKDINSTSGSGSSANMMAYGGKLYFNASDGVNGFELWETDGTSANTKMACDIRTAQGAGAGPSTFEVYANALLFTAQFDTTGSTSIVTGTELGIYRTTAGVATKEAATFAVSVKPTVAIDVVMVDVLSERTAKAEVQISDLLGHQFATKNIALTEGGNIESFDVSKLPNGLYFLTITVGDERQTKKFVKQ